MKPSELMFVAIVSIVVIYAAVSLSGPESAEDKAERMADECNDSAMAYSVSQTFVKRKLTAPSKAEFPSRSDSGVSALSLGDCRHRVVGYVDAQNQFGGTVRMTFGTDVKFDGKGNWLLEAIVIK